MECAHWQGLSLLVLNELDARRTRAGSDCPLVGRFCCCKCQPNAGMVVLGMMMVQGEPTQRKLSKIRAKSWQKRLDLRDVGALFMRSYVFMRPNGNVQHCGNVCAIRVPRDVG